MGYRREIIVASTIVCLRKLCGPPSTPHPPASVRPQASHPKRKRRGGKGRRNADARRHYDDEPEPRPAVKRRRSPRRPSPSTEPEPRPAVKRRLSPRRPSPSTSPPRVAPRFSPRQPSTSPPRPRATRPKAVLTPAMMQPTTKHGPRPPSTDPPPGLKFLSRIAEAKRSVDSATLPSPPAKPALWWLARIPADRIPPPPKSAPSHPLLMLRKVRRDALDKRH